MPDIHILNQMTIDKIAAGEVVERPLNVVKELTENAIDAGATAITIEIKDGGSSLIRVTDNGCGIPKDQIQKAFLRHATSKISSIEDLEKTVSLGFRGEALSSIAAVSEVEVITKTKEELTGIRFCIAGGQGEEPEEIGAPNGTTFLVRNLFFNTPARKKFLKQPQTEGGYVADMMEHLALSHPDISVKFIANGQLRFHTSGNGDLKEIIYRIYGRESADCLIPFSLEEEAFAVKGYLGRPELNRSNRNFETTYVNGRYVRNDTLIRAMEEGYRAYLMQHKFPFFVLHFSIDPSAIDVNVHPSKMEIRLHGAVKIYEALSREVAQKLHEQELIPDVKLTPAPKEEPPSPSLAPEPFEVRRSELLKENALLDKPQEYHTAAAQMELPKQPTVSDFMKRIPPLKILGTEAEESPTAIHGNVIKASEHILVEKPVQMDLFEERFLTEDSAKEYHIIGQIFETYWLVTLKDKLFIIDQHAAHEKVKYERFVKQLEEKQISSQLLNPPVIVSLTGKERQILAEHEKDFEALGFELEDFGSDSIAIRSMPVDLYGCNEKEFFVSLLDEMMEDPLKGNHDVILQKLATMACKAAVKGNHRLTEEEAKALIGELLSLKDPYHCPHGRPTIISMSKYELERKFKRIV